MAPVFFPAELHINTNKKKMSMEKCKVLDGFRLVRCWKQTFLQVDTCLICWNWNFEKMKMLAYRKKGNQTLNHQEFQVPKMEVLYLIRLFWGVGIPLHKPYIQLI